LKNRVQLIGRRGKDPIVNKTDKGTEVARFTLATNDSYKDSAGEKVEEVQWHNIVVWGRKAEVVKQYLTKGKEIAIEGKLAHRTFEDKEGNTRYISEVVVKELLMLSRPN
jgi:single-strand DNA-binding protein